MAKKEKRNRIFEYFKQTLEDKISKCKQNQQIKINLDYNFYEKFKEDYSSIVKTIDDFILYVQSKGFKCNWELGFSNGETIPIIVVWWKKENAKKVKLKNPEFFHSYRKRFF